MAPELRRGIAGGTFALAAAGAAAYVFSIGEEPLDLGGLIAAAGYEQVVPPANFYPPGTIITVERLSPGRIAVHPTCFVPEDLMKGRRVRSDTLDESHVQVFHRGVEVGADLISAAFGLKTDQEERTVLSLENVSVLVLSDSDLLDVRDALLTAVSSCQKAVLHNLSAGATVCQAASVLQADAVVRYLHSEGGDFEEKAKVLAEVTQQATLKALSGGSSLQAGEALFFGVRLTRQAILPAGATAAQDCLHPARAMHR